ncbi:hypothetical protein PR048_002666 [Dryococelus australis]|uniref:Uncharacterized protein n=1 Tax=Dryococelus australis TaxID=614101 RepID=A0ABQ9IKT3_9NEOP|nr:hypothetical protein PR048_002666 [Dryococelus australis]
MRECLPGAIGVPCPRCLQLLLYCEDAGRHSSGNLMPPEVRGHGDCRKNQSGALDLLYHFVSLTPYSPDALGIPSLIIAPSPVVPVAPHTSRKWSYMTLGCRHSHAPELTWSGRFFVSLYGAGKRWKGGEGDRVIEMGQRQNERVGEAGVPEKTGRPTASSDMILTCESPMPGWGLNPDRFGGRWMVPRIDRYLGCSDFAVSLCSDQWGREGTYVARFWMIPRDHQKRGKFDCQTDRNSQQLPCPHPTRGSFCTAPTFSTFIGNTKSQMTLAFSLSPEASRSAILVCAELDMVSFQSAVNVTAAWLSGCGILNWPRQVLNGVPTYHRLSSYADELSGVAGVCNYCKISCRAGPSGCRHNPNRASRNIPVTCIRQITLPRSPFVRSRKLSPETYEARHTEVKLAAGVIITGCLTLPALVVKMATVGGGKFGKFCGKNRKIMTFWYVKLAIFDGKKRKKGNYRSSGSGQSNRSAIAAITILEARKNLTRRYTDVATVPVMNCGRCLEGGQRVHKACFSVNYVSIARLALVVEALRKLNTMSAYNRQKAKSKYEIRKRLERASQKQSSDTHKTPNDRVTRCRERKKYTKATEYVNVDVFMQNKRPMAEYIRASCINVTCRFFDTAKDYRCFTWNCNCSSASLNLYFANRDKGDNRLYHNSTHVVALRNVRILHFQYEPDVGCSPGKDPATADATEPPNRHSYRWLMFPSDLVPNVLDRLEVLGHIWPRKHVDITKKED